MNWNRWTESIGLYSAPHPNVHPIDPICQCYWPCQGPPPFVEWGAQTRALVGLNSKAISQVCEYVNVLALIIVFSSCICQSCYTQSPGPLTLDMLCAIQWGHNTDIPTKTIDPSKYILYTISTTGYGPILHTSLPYFIYISFTRI